MTSWYLRSMADHDTHHGELNNGTVTTTLCGVQKRVRITQLHHPSRP